MSTFYNGMTAGEYGAWLHSVPLWHQEREYRTLALAMEGKGVAYRTRQRILNAVANDHQEYWSVY